MSPYTRFLNLARAGKTPEEIAREMGITKLRFIALRRSAIRDGDLDSSAPTFSMVNKVAEKKKRSETYQVKLQASRKLFREMAALSNAGFVREEIMDLLAISAVQYRRGMESCRYWKLLTRPSKAPSAPTVKASSPSAPVKSAAKKKHLYVLIAEMGNDGLSPQEIMASLNIDRLQYLSAIGHGRRHAQRRANTWPDLPANAFEDAEAAVKEIVTPLQLHAAHDESVAQLIRPGPAAYQKTA